MKLLLYILIAGSWLSFGLALAILVGELILLGLARFRTRDDDDARAAVKGKGEAHGHDAADESVLS